MDKVFYKVFYDTKHNEIIEVEIGLGEGFVASGDLYVNLDRTRFTLLGWL